jgi:hypothetical protein
MHDCRAVILTALALLGTLAMAQSMETPDTKVVGLIPHPGCKVQPVERMFRDRDAVRVNLRQAGVRGSRGNRAVATSVRF